MVDPDLPDKTGIKELDESIDILNRADREVQILGMKLIGKIISNNGVITEDKVIDAIIKKEMHPRAPVDSEVIEETCNEIRYAKAIRELLEKNRGEYVLHETAIYENDRERFSFSFGKIAKEGDVLYFNAESADESDEKMIEYILHGTKRKVMINTDGKSNFWSDIYIFRGKISNQPRDMIYSSEGEYHFGKEAEERIEKIKEQIKRKD